MLEIEPIKVLLIDDDEDDALIAQALLSDISGGQYIFDWCATYEDGLQEMMTNQHHVHLLDNSLGRSTGLELFQEALEKGCHIPAILLTGTLQPEIHQRAREAGFFSYQVKGQLDSRELARLIQQAIDHHPMVVG
ncbi:MAG: response regulator [Nitrospirae bacterium]|nr:response regulator [Nitrospirota bacterium]